MKSHLILFVLFLFCILLVFSHKFVMASNQSPTKELITGLNPHMLICSIAEEYEMIVVRCDPSLEGFRTVNKNDPPIESISVVMKSSNLERWGPRFSLMKNEETVGILQLGVFPDPNSASETYMDHIFHTSLGPNRDLTNEFGNQSAGWWNGQLDGFTRILFIRDNVVVNISLYLKNIINMGGSANIITEIAGALDLALTEGTLGVQRGAVINVPRILVIEIPAENPARTKVEATVHIAIAEDPNDPNSTEIEIFLIVPFYVPSTGSENQPMQLAYELIYITPNCVVASQEIMVTVTPRSIVIGDFENDMDNWGPTWEDSVVLGFSTNPTTVTLGSQSLKVQLRPGAYWALQWNAPTVPKLQPGTILQFDVTMIQSEWTQNNWIQVAYRIAINSDGPDGWKEFAPVAIDRVTGRPTSLDWGSWNPDARKTYSVDISDYDADGATWFQINISLQQSPDDGAGYFYIDNVQLLGLKP